MFKQRKILHYFLIGFVIVNVLQAIFTEIANDEAYYWMFSQHLDWGYFDHPPMIAALIATGYSIFQNELGVRLFTIVLTTLSVYLIWTLLPKNYRDAKKSQWVFVAIVAASPLLQIYSFVTTPDVPLIFFSVLFLYVFKRFLENDSWKNTLLLGLVMAGMAYSKYHGALVVLFALIANPRLLLRNRIYLAGAVTIILLIPHFWWQYQHDFATFMYHLKYRNENFKWESVYTYPLNTLLVLNPFLAPVVFYFLPRYKSKDSFERTLKFLFWGFIIFFGFSAIKSHVEPHWIAIVVVPTIYFLTQLFYQKRYKYLIFTSVITVVILLTARVILALPVALRTEFHGGKQAAKDMEAIAGDLPVAFLNTFQGPSKYNFYTGKEAFCYSSIYYRPTQYDFWNYEEKFNGKEVVIVPNYVNEYYDNAVAPSGKKKYFKKVDPFIFLDKLEINYPDNMVAVRSDTINSVSLTFKNPYAWDVDTKNPEAIVVQIAFKQGTRVKGIFNVSCELPEVFKAGEEYTILSTYKIDLPPGTYTYGYSFRTKFYLPFINSVWRPVVVN